VVQPRPDPHPPDVECVSPDRTPSELTALRARMVDESPTLRRTAEHFALLSSDTRVKILRLLRLAGELCVCDLATVLSMTPAAVSQHLSRLRSGGLVVSRRCGMTIYYRRSDRGACPAPDAVRMLEPEPEG
jgi:ArsR family transcriptional regulator